MANVQSFTNNPYQENTYILYDETGECAIIDPGMETAAEQNAVVNFIRANNLKPTLLLNTHCHIDHVLGNKFIFDQYGLKPKFIMRVSYPLLLEAVVAYAPAIRASGMRFRPCRTNISPKPGSVRFGNTDLTLIFALPVIRLHAHLCFYDEKFKYFDWRRRVLFK